MERKKKPNPFGWPFARRRHEWIAEADSLISEAADILDEAKVNPRRITRAIKLYVKSARLYRRAGLGVMAVASFQDAAECAAMLGDQSACLFYEAAADGIDTYYDEEVA